MVYFYCCIWVVNISMNVLMLTPDRVGSTMLQRVLTVYMLRKGFDKPVINLHELSNGLEKYLNTTLNQEVLGKPRGTEWGYFQSLPEVQELLESTDHYKTSRLAHYHIVRRQDSLKDQIPFYEYLNENFFIISCRRENLFEHVISWVIQAHSKRLNVYSPQEKVEVFNELYNNPIQADREFIWTKLGDYRNYIGWCDRYFNVQSYFNYEDSINNLEEYILNLPFMKNGEANTWQDMFGHSFDDWNRMHKAIPDLLLGSDPDGEVEITPYTALMSDWNSIRDNNWPLLPPPDLETADVSEEVKLEIKQKLDLPTIRVSKEKALYIRENLTQYKETADQINKVAWDGFLVSGIPIKLQTFEEKKRLVGNIDECIEWYNQWVEINNFGKPYNPDDHAEMHRLEELKMHDFSNLLENKSSDS